MKLVPSKWIIFAAYITKTGIANHTIPVITPNTTPFAGLSNKCNFTSFFSASQKPRVKATIANSGVISTHNLHIAGSFEDDNGNKETNIAHPRKKPRDFMTVIPIFFKINTSQASICRFHYTTIRHKSILQFQGERLKYALPLCFFNFLSFTSFHLQFCSSIPFHNKQRKV